MIQAGGEVNAQNEWGRTLLHKASGNGHVEVVNLLIQAGGEVNAQKEIVRATPLHEASWNGHVEVVDLLIRGGGEVNRGDKWGRTPLHEASRNGHVEVVNLLIQAGGDVNEKDETLGSTPLHHASRNGHVEVITALLAAGADKTIKTNGGKTPHDVAKNQDCKNALGSPTKRQKRNASPAATTPGRRGRSAAGMLTTPNCFL